MSVTTEREQIRKEVDKIDKALAKLRSKIIPYAVEMKIIQDRCKHSETIKKYGGSTGNYDKSEDCFWVEYTCVDCDKKWTEYK